ncbi:MAG: OsmC family peroxiredoxin [Rhizobiales bacterium]|nr:OsmC family peroxiredoxin [Hyphomicrobiales bacterium]
MVATTVELRNVVGTQAAMGWAGGHTIVVDRPDGIAGGLGLGFNGAQLLALAIGGCFCNDMRYVADEMGVQLGSISVSVTIELDGDPLITTAATMEVDCTTLDGSDPSAIVNKARSSCMVSNSISRGVPVTIKMAAAG